MTFRQRLLLAQVPLAAALLLVGVVVLRTVSSLGRASQTLLEDNYRSAVAAERMRDALDRLDRDALLRLAGREPAEPASVQRDRFEAELWVERTNITEPGEATAAQRLLEVWDAYQRAYASVPTASDPVAAVTGPLGEASAAVRKATDEIVALNQSAMVRKSAEARLAARRLLLFMAVATFSALALGFVASAALTARTARPLSALTQAVRSFGEGRLDARVRPTGEGEIADLGREFDTMADRLEQYRRSTLGELLQAQRAVQAAIDALPDPVLVLDARGAVLNLNLAAEALAGLGRDQGVDEPLPALEPVLRERLESVRAHVLSGKGPYVPRGLDEAVRVDRPEGPRRFLPRATALLSADHAVSGAAIVLQDVTRLARMDELRNDLVSTVAHEFRTPLTSLQMAVHLCENGAAGPLTDEQAELMGGARQDCERLQGIVDDILDLSRIRAGRIAIRTQLADAGGLLECAAAAARAGADAKGIALDVQAPGTPVPVLADADRIGVVLGNLLGNAVRHTPAGGRIVARALRSGASVRFEVRDTGPGVPSEHRDAIFERFHQVPGSKGGDLGLGLFISREIVHAHGGDMGVESTAGAGSTFWFTLTAASAGPDALGGERL